MERGHVPRFLPPHTGGGPACRIQATPGGVGREFSTSPHVARFVERLREAEEDLEREVSEQQRRWRYRVERGCVWFDTELRESHRRLRQSIPAYIREGDLGSLLEVAAGDTVRLPATTTAATD